MSQPAGIPPTTNVEQQFNWLTAEDILKAAEDSDFKITHSPIVLIPYDQEAAVPKDSFDLDLDTIPKDVFSNNIAILDNLSSQLLAGNEISPQFSSVERVGCSSFYSKFSPKSRLIGKYFTSRNQNIPLIFLKENLV